MSYLNFILLLHFLFTAVSLHGASRSDVFINEQTQPLYTVDYTVRPVAGVIPVSGLMRTSLCIIARGAIDEGGWLSCTRSGVAAYIPRSTSASDAIWLGQAITVYIVFRWKPAGADEKAQCIFSWGGYNWGPRISVRKNMQNAQRHDILFSLPGYASQGMLFKTAINAADWTSVRAVLDKKSGKAALYVNKKEAGTINEIAQVSLRDLIFHPVLFGGSQAGPMTDKTSDHFNGDIRECIIFPKAVFQ